MDLLSAIPDLLVQYLFRFLTEGDIGRISGVSRLFRIHSVQHFSNLCTSYNYSSDSPLSDYGNIYSQRVLIINSWNLETASKIFLHYNLVKSVKFASEFFSVLRYDGSLYSNINTQGLELVGEGVKEIDCCLHGMIVWEFNGIITWWKKMDGEIVKARFDSDEVSVIAASVYGIIGRKDGKVFAFEGEYQREVEFVEKNTCGIKDIKASPKMLLILTDDGNLYVCGMIVFEASLIRLNCVRFAAIGNSHSLALKQAKIAQVNTWSTEVLIDFMKENGFEDCCKVILNHEVDGSDMQNMNEKYFLETLGIREPDRRNKLKYLLKQANSQGFSKKFEIFGWGRNKSMQLGPDGFAHNSPIKLLPPDLVEGEKILSVHCDKVFSYLLTSTGKVLVLGGKSLAKIQKAEKKNVKWEEIQNKLIEKGKIVSIETSNKMLAVIYLNEIKSKKKIKMRMAEDILRMVSNGKIPASAYEIGHLDRFLGILETTLPEFNKTDIPKHRIQYFKRNGKMVWDRRDRTDIF